MVESVDPTEGAWARRFPGESRDHGEPLLLRIREVAGLCGLSVSLTAQLVANGTITSIQIGRARRVVRAELEAWIGERIAEAR